MTLGSYIRQIFYSIKGYIHSGNLYILKICNTLYDYVKGDQNGILLNSWINYKFGRLKPNNWGDDINVFLVESLTGLKAKSKWDLLRNGDINYTIIGSLVDIWINRNTIIWGGGALYGENYPLKARPKQVCAVRGKLTRDYLLANDVDCPPIYGDPALLLPMIYTPDRVIKYEIGFIPHRDDLKNPLYSTFLKHHPGKCIVINLHDYKDWREVIDKISACEIVLSSSLHGLIVADAYHVPNIWIKSSVPLHGGNFKFLDYFSGVNRPTITPFKMDTSTTRNEIMELAKAYHPIEWDPNPLIKACPFKIKI